MKYFVILIIFFITISINESYAEMSYSEFQDFCKETKNTNLDLMPVDQRLLAYLCDFLDSGLSEKYWNWIGADLNWKNFAQNVSDEYAQEIPLFVEKGLEDSLVVDTSISGRDSFPPPMSVYISFYYDEDNKTKRFGEKYMVKISGEFTKAKDHRLPPLKLFKIGYHLDEIQCKENLILLQKYDGTPSCVTEQTRQKLIERGWTLTKITKPVSNNYNPYETRCSSGAIPYIPKNWHETEKQPSDEQWENLGRHLMKEEFYKQLKQQNIIFEPACFGIYKGGVEWSYPPRISMCTVVSELDGDKIYLEGTAYGFDVIDFEMTRTIPYQCDELRAGCFCNIENEN